MPEASVDEARPPDLAAKVAALQEEIERINARLEKGDAVMQGLEKNLQTNTEATARIEINTSTIVEFFQAMAGAFKVFNWIGRLAKPLGAIATVCITLWTAWTTYRGGGHT